MVHSLVVTLRSGCVDGDDEAGLPGGGASGGAGAGLAKEQAREARELREERTRSVLRVLPELLVLVADARRWVVALRRDARLALERGDGGGAREAAAKAAATTTAEATDALWSCLVDVSVAGAAVATAAVAAAAVSSRRPLSACARRTDDTQWRRRPPMLLWGSCLQGLPEGHINMGLCE